MDDINIILDQLKLGPMDNFFYFIGDARIREVFAVDPAFEIEKIFEHIKAKAYHLTGILLTHSHFDHTHGVKELLEVDDVPVYLSEKEKSYFNLKYQGLCPLQDRKIIKVGGIEIECLLTPGHSPGSLCYKCGDILLTGDTLFIDGCGRCDLAGGDVGQMYASLYEVIGQLPDSTVIYPGHDYGAVSSAPLGNLKKSNPYLTCSSRDEFIHQRM